MLDSETLMTVLDISDDAAGAMTTSERLVCHPMLTERGPSVRT
jgi:hypothetical protein